LGDVRKDRRGRRSGLRARSLDGGAEGLPGDEEREDGGGEGRELEPSHDVVGVAVGQQVDLAVHRHLRLVVGGQLVDGPGVVNEAR
jgi:hypothetical protein